MIMFLCIYLIIGSVIAIHMYSEGLKESPEDAVWVLYPYYVRWAIVCATVVGIAVMWPLGLLAFHKMKDY